MPRKTLEELTPEQRSEVLAFGMRISSALADVDGSDAEDKDIRPHVMTILARGLSGVAMLYAGGDITLARALLDDVLPTAYATLDEAQASFVDNFPGHRQ